MLRPGSIRRRMLWVLVLFSLTAALPLAGVGAYLVARSVGEPRFASGPPAAGPWVVLGVALLFGAGLILVAVRVARSIERDLSAEIAELLEWTGRIGRQEPIPPPAPGAGELAGMRDALREMADALEKARAAARVEALERGWNDAATAVASELRGSVSRLRQAVRALEQWSGRAAAEPVPVLSRESARLEELARDLAQLGQPPTAPVHEIDLVEQLGSLLRTQLPPGVEHRLRAPVDLPHIHGHRGALARAFTALLLDAAEEARQSGGTITVKLSTHGHDGIEIRVLDAGRGIPAEDLERIWQPGSTLRGRRPGIGLALVRRTVLAHGGAVAARNRPEGGTELRVLLPIGRPAADAGPTETPET